jgi:hypothetical protein
LFKLMSALFADVFIRWHNAHSSIGVKLKGQGKRGTVRDA